MLLRKAILGCVFDSPPSLQHNRERHGGGEREKSQRGGVRREVCVRVKGQREGCQGRSGMRVRPAGVLCAKDDYGEGMTVDNFYRRERRRHQKEYGGHRKVMVLIRSRSVFIFPSKA